MTVAADGRIGVAAVSQCSVSTRLIGIYHLRMADGAIDLRCYRGAGTFLGGAGAGMTLRARGIAVNRIVNLSCIDSNRYGDSIASHGHAWLGVTFKAVTIRHSQLIKNLPDPVRRMTVYTNRNLVGGFFP